MEDQCFHHIVMTDINSRVTWVSTIGTVVSNMESQMRRSVARFCLSIGFVLQYHTTSLLKWQL